MNEHPKYRPNIIHFVVFSPQIEKDERSDEDSNLEEDKREEAEEDYCLTERKGTQSYKLAPLSKNCVLNNLTNHRSSVSGRMCQAP